MLLHEPPVDYILYCREAIKVQQKFIEAVTREKDRHLNESVSQNHEGCKLCAKLDDCLSDQQEILSDFEERYKRSRKGIYE